MSKGSQEVYLALRESILSGAYPPGTHLSAQDIAEKLDVSRTPAREGLLKLAAEGLVNLMPNQGAFVASWTPEELVDLYDLRAVLEPMAAEAAATRIGEQDLAALEELVVRMEQAVARKQADIATLSECNDAYHRIVAAACGNRKLTSAINSTIAIPMGSTVFRLSTPQRLERLMNHYRELIVAFRVRDPQWARAVMQCHVLSARSLYARLAAGEPDIGM
jgi:DNA-binding GntR family transcriptional regulator